MAIDPNSAAPIRVLYRLDGVNQQIAAANLPGRSFSRRWTLAPGTHTLQVFALNVGAGTANTLIGQRVVAVASPSTKNAQIAAYAKTFVGRYRYTSNGSSPATGFDCSGLTAYVYARHGIGLPHNAQAQLSSMRAISQSQARPGDLVFFMGGGYAFHVGIYEGGNMMVSAATTAEGIKYQSIWSSDVRFATNLH
jgi:cell wall-associated NlpC family hydrolase